MYDKDNEQKMRIIGIFLSQRDMTLPKIYRSEPNSNLTCVFSWHEFQFQMSNSFGDNEQKPKIIWTADIHRLEPNSNLTCIFSWNTYMPVYPSKCAFVMEIMCENQSLLEFFKGHNSTENYSIRLDRNSNLTCKLYIANICTKCHISMYDRDNKWKLNPDWRKDRRTEERKGVTLNAQVIQWRGIKNSNSYKEMTTLCFQTLKTIEVKGGEMWFRCKNTVLCFIQDADLIIECDFIYGRNEIAIQFPRYPKTSEIWYTCVDLEHTYSLKVFSKGRT